MALWWVDQKHTTDCFFPSFWKRVWQEEAKHIERWWSINAHFWGEKWGKKLSVMKTNLNVFLTMYLDCVIISLTKLWWKPTWAHKQMKLHIEWLLEYNFYQAPDLLSSNLSNGFPSHYEFIFKNTTNYIFVHTIKVYWLDKNTSKHSWKDTNLNCRIVCGWLIPFSLTLRTWNLNNTISLMCKRFVVLMSHLYCACYVLLNSRWGFIKIHCLTLKRGRRPGKTMCFVTSF